MPTLASAQTDNRAAAREIVRKWQDAIVNVRVTLKLRMSMGGREMNASDDSVDTVGTVIESVGPDGRVAGRAESWRDDEQDHGRAAAGQDRPS